MTRNYFLVAALALCTVAAATPVKAQSNPFTEDTYQLVTATEQLQDSDQIIIGLYTVNQPYIMGYFDESVSKNNIRAIAGSYTANRTQVSENENAVYTLHTAELDGRQVFYIQDEIRYEEAYLVASGGKTKNVLAAWNKLYDSKTYGNYGYWDIAIATNGEATICNMGNSLGKYLQYNATNRLFACYQEPNSQTAVSIYRLVRAIGDTTAILAAPVAFGTVCLRGESVVGSATQAVYANGLSADISLHLKHGSPFRLSVNTLPMSGGALTLSYEAAAAGVYSDTLVLQSGAVCHEVGVSLQVVCPKTVAEAVQSAEYEPLFLDTVVVTKKYDRYVFVRDATGSMLIYDNGDSAGKRYAKDLKNGHVLIGVEGRFHNYYGVPELLPTAAWRVGNRTVTCEPERFDRPDDTAVPVAVDSADVCRYLRLEGVVIDGENTASAQWLSPIGVSEVFGKPSLYDTPSVLDAVVMIDHDVVQLWYVSQQPFGTGVESVSVAPVVRKTMRNGIVVVEQDGITHTLMGASL